MRWLRLAIPALVLPGCGSMVSNMVADALSEGGGAMAKDEDPELVAAAAPFGLKTYESVLEAVPEHAGLLSTTAAGFVQYAYAFVTLEAERVADSDLARSREMRLRARKLFLRGRDYALRGLELTHPGITAELNAGSTRRLADATKRDVPFLYWAGAGWAGALMSDKSDTQLVAGLPVAAALVRRVLELDPAFNAGAADEFLISYESRSETMGGSPARAREHYMRALHLSDGKRASVHVALAEGVCVPAQDVAEFKRILAMALAVDPEADPPNRLANVLARRRAEWLLARIPDLFLEGDQE